MICNQARSFGGRLSLGCPRQQLPTPGALPLPPPRELRSRVRLRQEREVRLLGVSEVPFVITIAEDQGSRVSESWRPKVCSKHTAHLAQREAAPFSNQPSQAERN